MEDLKIVREGNVEAPAEAGEGGNATSPPAGAQGTGPEYWRSLEELAQTESFFESLKREFPRQALPLAEGVDRRRFLQLMGASLALGGLTACTRQPPERIVPYVRQPEELVPGNPLFFASAYAVGGYANGILVESHEGRPTKIEGNPDHPTSLGATDLFTQASVLDLYDPDRSQAVTNLGRIRTWADFVEALTNALGSQQGDGGAGVRLLTGVTTSPSVKQQMEAIIQRFPKARWYQYEPINRRSAHLGAKAATGDWAEVRYELEPADVIVSLDSDLLTQGPGSVRHARQFGERRRVLDEKATMNRLYVIESAPTATGTLADHRLALPPADVEAFSLALAAALGVPGIEAPSGFSAGEKGRFVQALARDLKKHGGRSLVVAGEHTSPELHTVAFAINQQLGNVGKTLFFTDPVLAQPGDPFADIRELASELAEGKVQVLIMSGVNPVYDAPVDLDFAKALKNEATWLRVHHGLQQDETAPYCHWHVPAAHYLESWSDTRAVDGTTTIQQPLIEPLYGGKPLHDLLAVVAGQPGVTDHDVIRQQWVDRLGGEAAWRRAVHDGFVEKSQAPIRQITAINASAAAATLAQRVSAKSKLALIFRPDPTLWDGRYANNGWLQECPKPFSKLTWDNALYISPRTAKNLGVDTGHLVQVTADGRSLDVPVWVLPTHCDGAATLSLGFGRTRAGRVANGHGVDAYALRTSAGEWTLPAVAVKRLGRTYEFASTKGHFQMENRHLVRAASLPEYHKDPEFAAKMEEAPADDMTLYPKYSYDGYAWGMAINLSACTGCNACIVACQSENNIAVVGKDQVHAGREMQWIRIDQYYTGDYDNPTATYNQPVPCQQCENAPCELVCPVAATVHSSEGLNDMVYNRCVGTRYCSNNCPYKVRRFNFYKYQDWVTPSLKLQRNPDVTIRFRGVMEKCTYCVQRISHARIAAGRSDRELTAGEIVTACQQACPTGAIVFGNINNPDEEVAKWKGQPLNYGLLAELNTRPRTSYLARLSNPNPELS